MLGDLNYFLWWNNEEEHEVFQSVYISSYVNKEFELEIGMAAIPCYTEHSTHPQFLPIPVRCPARASMIVYCDSIGLHM